jgi:hypothetical protein
MLLSDLPPGETYLSLRLLLFWDVAWSRLVVTSISGYHIGPISRVKQFNKIIAVKFQ